MAISLEGGKNVLFSNHLMSTNKETGKEEERLVF
jgi:hypothetical protein